MTSCSPRCVASYEQRARSEAALRARLVESETRVAARQLLERQTAATLRAAARRARRLEGHVHARTGRRVGRPSATPQALERDLARLRLQTGEAYAAIAELRGVIESLRAVVTEAPPTRRPAADVDPEADVAEVELRRPTVAETRRPTSPTTRWPKPSPPSV